MKLLLIFLLFSCLNPIHSQSEIAEKVIKALELDSAELNTGMIEEKAMPNTTSDFILIIPEITDSGEGYFSLKTFIVIFDKSTGKIKNKQILYKESDAVTLTGFTIDTAPYILSKGTRAFGIRTKYRGSSKANPYDVDELSLFIPQGDSLNEVLKDFVVDQFNGDWDTNCTGEFTDQSKVLIITSKMTNGFYDILVKNTIIKEETFVTDKGDCDEKSKTSYEKQVLKFGKHIYQ